MVEESGSRRGLGQARARVGPAQRLEAMHPWRRNAARRWGRLWGGKDRAGLAVGSESGLGLVYFDQYEAVRIHLGLGVRLEWTNEYSGLQLV